MYTVHRFCLFWWFFMETLANQLIQESRMLLLFQTKSSIHYRIDYIAAANSKAYKLIILTQFCCVPFWPCIKYQLHSWCDVYLKHIKWNNAFLFTSFRFVWFLYWIFCFLFFLYFSSLFFYSLCANQFAFTFAFNLQLFYFAPSSYKCRLIIKSRKKKK